MKKIKTFLIRIEAEKLKEYNFLCKKHGLNKSQRFRNFIESEIKKLKNYDIV